VLDQSRLKLGNKTASQLQRELNRIIAAVIAARDAKEINCEPAVRLIIIEENYDKEEKEDKAMVDGGKPLDASTKKAEDKTQTEAVQTFDGAKKMDID